MTGNPSMVKINSDFKIKEIIEEAKNSGFIDDRYFDVKLTQYAAQFASCIVVSNLTFFEAINKMNNFKERYPKRISFETDIKRIYFEKKLYNFNVFLFYLYYSKRYINNDSFFDLFILKSIKLIRFIKSLIIKNR